MSAVGDANVEALESAMSARDGVGVSCRRQEVRSGGLVVGGLFVADDVKKETEVREKVDGLPKGR